MRGRPRYSPVGDPGCGVAGSPCTALVREFERLNASSADAVAGWRARRPSLMRCRSLCDVVSRVADDPDPVLAALILEAQSGCELAALAVVRVMVPKLILMAKREPAIRVEEFVTQLWLRIMDYPLRRRPHRIAANLALDTRKALRAERSPRVVPVEDIEDALRCEDVEGEPDPRHLLRTAANLGLVDPETHAVMISVYADGISRPLVAQHHQVTPRTIQRRCSRGLRLLATHSDELLAAL